MILTGYPTEFFHEFSQLDKQFDNFMTAESWAENVAFQNITESGNRTPAFELIREKKAGRPLSPEEQTVVIDLYFQSLNTLKRKILTQLIEVGLVRDCRMSRRYMACLPTC